MRKIVFRDKRTFQMSHKSTIARSLFAAVALVTTAVAISAPTKPNWMLIFTVSDKGAHIVGNPAAPSKVVEYMSYTCSHCANFENMEATPFKAKYVANGKASLEVRNLILNPVDLTAAMLARCGGKGRFFGNHKHLFATQKIWLSKTNKISTATATKLKTEDYVGFMTGVYTEIGLSTIMQQRGITLAQGKACLADKAAFNAIIDMTDEGSQLGVNGTPTFLINGKVQDHVHDFQALKSILN